MGKPLWERMLDEGPPEPVTPEIIAKQEALEKELEEWAEAHRIKKGSEEKK